jgi:hypothetical protein
MSKARRLKQFVETIARFLKGCVEEYVQDLHETFVWRYMRSEATLKDLDQGYADYIEELRDPSKFANFCSRSFRRDPRIELESPVYEAMLRKAHSEMVRTYQDPFLLKTYAITHSAVGKSIDDFLQRCSQLFVETVRESEGPKYREVVSKDRLFRFCETINTQLHPSKQRDTRSSLFDTFLDDYFYRIVMCNI